MAMVVIGKLVGVAVSFSAMARFAVVLMKPEN